MSSSGGVCAGHLTKCLSFLLSPFLRSITFDVRSLTISVLFLSLFLSLFYSFLFYSFLFRRAGKERKRTLRARRKPAQSDGALKRGAASGERNTSSVVAGGAWESISERKKDRGRLRVAGVSERVRVIRERRRDAGSADARGKARLFDVDATGLAQRRAAQCSSNGVALRRDHAAAPCATDRPISGTRQRDYR